MYLLKLLFFIVLVLFLSCSPAKDEKNLSVEVEPIQLKPTLVHFKGNEVLYPTEFAIIDSSLLIIESEAKEHKFKFFDLVDHQFHHSFGVEGNGPDEYSKFIAQPVSAVDS